RGDEARLDLIELDPLRQYARLVEVRLHAPVELPREEARHAAHPGVGWLGDDEVVAPPLRREVALRVVDDDAAAGVCVGGAVAWRETARGFRHGGLDLDRVDALDVEALQQGVGGQAGTDADYRGRLRVRLQRERYGRGQHHGDLVRTARAVRLEVDGAVGLAVRAQADRFRVAHEMHRCRLAVLLEQHRRVRRRAEFAVAEDAGRHLVRVELDAEDDGG